MRKFWLLPFGLLAIALGYFLFSGSEESAETTTQKGEKKGTTKEAKDPKQQAQEGIRFFEGTWKAAREKAAETGKPLFVDAYAEWCGPCKVMDKRVFTRKTVGEFYNKHFINYQYDMEKGKGPQFRQKYKVTAYPTLLFFNSTGRVVYRQRGAMGPSGLLKTGKKALQAMDGQKMSLAID